MAQHPWGLPLNHPGGLESRYTYRFLTFNDKTANDRYHLDRIEGFYDLPRTRLVEFPNPGRDGVTMHDMYYGGRTVVLTGRIMAGNLAKLRYMEHQLRHNMAYDQTETQMTIKNVTGSKLLYSDYYSHMRPIELMIGDAFRADGLSANFRAVFQASDPRIYGATIRERDISFTANATVSDPIWNFPNYGNWYARANVRFMESSNATTWSVTNPRVMLSQKVGQAIGVMYSGSATGAAATYREVQGGSFSSSAASHGAGYVRILDQALSEWGNQNLLNQGVAYTLVIPPVGFDPDRAGRGGSITTFCTAKTNTAIARVRWIDTWL